MLADRAPDPLLHFFVGVPLAAVFVQAFEKVPVLKAIAPTQKEPPFAIAQLTLLVFFVVLGVFAVKKFHIDEPVAARARA